MTLSLLTPAEHRIAELAARGLSMQEIAKALNWTPASVKVYLARRIYPKLGIHSQPALIRWWIEYVEQRGDCSKCALKQAHLIGIESPQAL